VGAWGFMRAGHNNAPGDASVAAWHHSVGGHSGDGDDGDAMAVCDGNEVGVDGDKAGVCIAKAGQ